MSPLGVPPPWGEKARLAMAIMLFDPPNFGVLDKRANQPGMAAKEKLIKALAQYEGTGARPARVRGAGKGVARRRNARAYIQRLRGDSGRACFLAHP